MVYEFSEVLYDFNLSSHHTAKKRQENIVISPEDEGYDKYTVHNNIAVQLAKLLLLKQAKMAKYYICLN